MMESFNQDRSPAIICDLDGTLCDLTARLPLIKQIGETGPKWEEFHMAAANDPVILPCLILIRALAAQGWKIYYVTGRVEKSRELTEGWLDRFSCPKGPLLMRQNGDYRKDTIIKREIYENSLKYKNIIFALEDRDQVVTMWRELGVTCYQVCKGEY